MPVPHPSPSVAALLAVLEPGAPVGDLYGPQGSDVYDAMTLEDGSEVREVLRAARRTSGDILELASGSGRLTVPLARLGREVVALDSSPRMRELLVARARSARAESIRPVLADMSAFELHRTFGLIVLATTSITLLDAAERGGLLRSVRRHLAPDGVFLVSVPTKTPVDDTGRVRIVPLGRDADDLVLLSDEVDAPGGHRDVGVIRLRRAHGRMLCDAFASRVRLLDESGLRDEVQAAGLVVQESVAVRAPGRASGVSMIACSR